MDSPETREASAQARRKTPLSRETVLTKAVELVDSDDVEALTMRRLGQALGRDSMSLYRYAENRIALLDGVAELVLNDLSIQPEDPDWKAQLRLLAHDLRLLALRHPNVVPLLVTRPLSTPLGMRPLGTLRPLEQILSLLIEAGFAQGCAPRLPCLLRLPLRASPQRVAGVHCGPGRERGYPSAGTAPPARQGIPAAPCPCAGTRRIRRFRRTRAGHHHPADRP